MIVKILSRTIVTLLAVVVTGVGLLYLSGNSFIITSLQRTYFVGQVTANINDHTEFKTNVIAADFEQTTPNHPDYNRASLPTEFIRQLESTKTAAFLVVKDGQVLSESYFSDYHDRSKTNSFSMAKTVTTLLLGIAIEEGLVRDLNQPITDFLPEFIGDPLAEKATIGQLSWMTSGYDWDENYYSPFSPTVELYYGNDVRNFLFSRQFVDQPGDSWYYSSASTQLMGIFLLRAIQKARGKLSLSEYLSQKLWRPMGMNDDASWHTDGTGMELTYCCLNTNARNYAKLGQLMMNMGEWQGQQLVPSEFVKKMTQAKGDPVYGLSTWLGASHSPEFYSFSGHLGQLIVVVPEENLVVVRLGEKPYPSSNFIGVTAPRYIEAAMSLY